MADSPYKLSRFWQELKRRKVTRVITVYAAAAFVILELTSIVAPSLGLPDWTLNFIIILLCVGFIIAVILSWIYDVGPEGGIVKTEPVKEDVVDSEASAPPSSRGWKIASIISLVVIVALIILNIVTRTDALREDIILDKSIAVLPFYNDSQDQENEDFINGTMESILTNLSKIEDLSVRSRSSVEQYRDTVRYIPDVAEMMMVSYVLEGSMQKYGSHIRMTLQLIDKNDNHVWSEQYDREITKVEDHLSLQSEIAQLVAAELQAVITPEEKQLINKISTTSLTAFDLYTQGRERLWEYSYENEAPSLEKAESLFKAALTYDSTYAEGYTGLAWVYWIKNYYSDLLAESFLDSVLILVDKALTYDDKLSEAYLILGWYYFELGEFQEADNAFNHAIVLDPNNWLAYRYKSTMNLEIDLVEYIENGLKAAVLNKGPELPGMLRGLGGSLANAGFFDMGSVYFKQALELDGDSAGYMRSYGLIEILKGNYDRAIQYYHQALDKDSSNVTILSTLGYSYSFIGQFEKSVKYYKRWLSKSSAYYDPEYRNMLRVGYAFHGIGEKEKAEEYFDQQVENCRISIELGRKFARQLYDYYNLAAVYAFRGNRESAYENLRKFNQREIMPLWMVTLINDDPMFENIRDEPEFQQIVRDVEAKYQAEHERVRLWLEENDML